MNSLSIRLVFSISLTLPGEELLVSTGKIELSCPRVGRSSSPTTMFEETEVRESDSYLKLHGNKWCWCGAQVPGFPVQGFFLFITMIYWVLLFSLHVLKPSCL